MSGFVRRSAPKPGQTIYLLTPQRPPVIPPAKYGSDWGLYAHGIKIINTQNQSQIIIIRRAPGPCGASPTQPYKCSQNVKIKIKTALANAEINKLANAEINKLVLTLTLTF
jgi:hypothetical protein